MLTNFIGNTEPLEQLIEQRVKNRPSGRTASNVFRFL